MILHRLCHAGNRFRLGFRLPQSRLGQTLSLEDV